MVMMALLPLGGLLGGYGADPDGANGSWEEAPCRPALAK